MSPQVFWAGTVVTLGVVLSYQADKIQMNPPAAVMFQAAIWVMLLSVLGGLLGIL